MVRVIEGKIKYKWSEMVFGLAGDSSYRGFELPRVNYSKCMTEIQGKLKLAIDKGLQKLASTVAANAAQENLLRNKLPFMCLSFIFFRQAFLSFTFEFVFLILRGQNHELLSNVFKSAKACEHRKQIIR